MRFLLSLSLCISPRPLCCSPNNLSLFSMLILPLACLCFACDLSRSPTFFFIPYLSFSHFTLLLLFPFLAVHSWSWRLTMSQSCQLASTAPLRTCQRWMGWWWAIRSSATPLQPRRCPGSSQRTVSILEAQLSSTSSSWLDENSGQMWGD